MYSLSFTFLKVLFLSMAYSHCILGQQTLQNTITLNSTLEIATNNSLDALMSKRTYSSRYWVYRSFQAKLLPRVSMELEPFTYNRSFIKRYDPINNIDIYRLQQNLNTFAQLSISQNIQATGATIFANSTFNRLENFGDNSVENYSTTPVRIGLLQPIMAFNELKWEKKTANLEYERAKKEYISRKQHIYLKTVSIFFRWALAKTKLKIALENQINANRFYGIGQKRYPLGSIERVDLLNLELDTYSADTQLANTEQQLRSVVNELQLFLDKDYMFEYTPELPEVIPRLKIDYQEALEMARNNNPDLLSIKIQKIQADRDLDKIIKENRFDFSISASYGLNQQSQELTGAYSDFLNQQMVALQFSLPLLDWGQREGNIKTAKMDKEVKEIQIEQNRTDIEQQLLQNVESFNLQEKFVLVALKTRDVARESYEITEKRFLSGKIDLLRLQTARKVWQSAFEEYIESLQNYWEYYYEVQQLTLYDFMQESRLVADFDLLLKE